MKKLLYLFLLTVLPIISFGQSVEILPGNNVNGNIISNSGAFPAMHMFLDGTSNPDKMVISHSPAHSSWGLQYRDLEDMFVFTGNSYYPNLSIDLGSALGSVKVGVGTDSPNETFHVMGNTRLESVNPMLQLRKTGSTGLIGTIFQSFSGSTLGFMGFDDDDNLLRLSYGNTSSNHLTVKSNGYVGLGTDNASQKLNIVDGNILLESGSTDRVLIERSGGASGGEITLFASNGTKTMEIKGSDATNKAGEILLYDPTTNLKTLEIDGDWSGSGKSRIITDELEIKGGSDFAEYFDVIEKSSIQPGMVLSALADGSGKLAVASNAYDKKVVGIVSGANGVSTGLMLRQKGNETVDGSHPIAISGRVYVYADAKYGKIQVGDLLTTSETAGHVMKSKNYRKSRGATVGKALSNLEAGQGFVLVLLDSK